MGSYRLIATEQGLQPVIEQQSSPLPTKSHIGAAAAGSNVVGWYEIRPPHSESVTQNDAYIVDKLLNNPSTEIYDVLVGKTDVLPHWPAGAQQKAQAGLSGLIRTEYAPYLSFEAQDIRGMRRGVQNLRRMGLYDKHAAYGHKVEYQSTQNPQVFDDTYEDYLYFGVPNKPSAHTPLLSPRRIYVHTTLTSGGQVAADVITHSRSQGIEPYGKVLDQSTKAKDISLRKDGLLFVANTQEQFTAIMHGLRRSYHQHAASFNSDVLLMTETTDIPGVSIAEEPTNDGIKMSYNERAGALVANAWNAALDIFPSTKLDMIGANDSVGGRVERIQLLRQLMRSGTPTQEQMTGLFSSALRQEAPALGISPDHIARNL